MAHLTLAIAIRTIAVLSIILTMVEDASAQAPQVRRGEPGQNITLHEAYNWSGTVYVRMLNAETGEPAIATFWSVKEFTNRDRGTHSGVAEFQISGLRDELRAGHIQAPTVFYVTADGAVWQTISDASLEELCRRFGC